MHSLPPSGSRSPGPSKTRWWQRMLHAGPLSTEPRASPPRSHVLHPKTEPRAPTPSRALSHPACPQHSHRPSLFVSVRVFPRNAALLEFPHNEDLLPINQMHPLWLDANSAAIRRRNCIRDYYRLREGDAPTQYTGATCFTQMRSHVLHPDGATCFTPMEPRASPGFAHPHLEEYIVLGYTF